MAVMTIRLPDDQHRRLKALADSQGVSVNRLIQDLSVRVLTEHDVETWFRLKAAAGQPSQGLAILDKLDAHFALNDQT
jgi:predicted transcriptional regulator